MMADMYSANAVPFDLGGPPAGLRLLGFKPLCCLKGHHRLRQAAFLYPDEATLHGSTRAFTTIHHAMLDSSCFAVCSMTRNKISDTRLVALVAAQELQDEYHVQVRERKMRAAITTIIAKVLSWNS